MCERSDNGEANLDRDHHSVEGLPSAVCMTPSTAPAVFRSKLLKMPRDQRTLLELLAPRPCQKRQPIPVDARQPAHGTETLIIFSSHARAVLTCSRDGWGTPGDGSAPALAPCHGRFAPSSFLLHLPSLDRHARLADASQSPKSRSHPPMPTDAETCTDFCTLTTMPVCNPLPCTLCFVPALRRGGERESQSSATSALPPATIRSTHGIAGLREGLRRHSH
ncbi:hypothetical protein F5X68DRAFT_56505 [Plectosphaerella plurivora]|uniref:Uncharacterized protein n=1 Tax=Plectosphaerella plurivora TaxID=936078 RepID=A0A9P8V1G3_9PEZI|nr:hypothetical protein F5X68DRAFT_56505 [Plectosphaerella plurivora]